MGDGMNPELVIFDCDGVLVDSEILANEVFAEALKSLGINLSLEETMNRFVGLNRMSMTSSIESEFGVKITDQFWDELRHLTWKAFDGKLKPIPGVVDLVAKLASKKCVASSSGPQSIKHSLSLVGLWERFAPYVYSAHQVKNGKPAPDLFLYAAAQLQTPPSSCLVIEDSLAGVRAAKAAKMRVFGFVGGSHCSPGHADVLRREGVEQVFSDMKVVAELLVF